ncbi:MAG: hypothetical protein VB061_06660 [Christensenella sp.]|nr:hypothetical protein [Christensenella sp.]
MTTCKFNRETALRIGTIFLLICIVARIVQISLYSYATFYQTVQSDMAGDLLQAELAASQGHLLFANNWYVSTELRVIGINIIPTILFYFGLSYQMIWALTCGISAIFISGGVYLAMRMLRIERFESLLASLLILLPTSALSYCLYTYPIYPVFMILMLFLTVLMTELITSDIPNWRVCLLGLLVSFLSGLCGARLIIQAMLPIVGFVLYREFRKHIRDDMNVSLIKDVYGKTWRVLLCAAGICAGYFVYAVVLCGRYGQGAAPMGIGSIQQISQGLLYLPKALLEVYGLSYQPTSIGTGFALAAQLLYLAAVYACYGWLLVNRNRLDARKNNHIKIMTVLVVFSFLLVCFLKDRDGDQPIWRYFALGTYSMLLVIPLAISNWSRRSLRYVLAVMVSLLVFAYPCYQQAREISQRIGEVYNPPAYLRYLEENQFSFGEATFWNANVNIINSDGEIRIKPVINDENLSFFAWLTHKDYIDQEAEFLLLTQEEYQLRLQNGWQTPYQFVFADDKYVIFAESPEETP